MIVPYAAAYLVIVAVFLSAAGSLADSVGLGAAIGVWELLRIRRRKVLI